MKASLERFLSPAALSIGLAVVQVFDILIHAITGQLEFLRVVANLALLVWLALLASGRLGGNLLQASFFAVGFYLTLNISFLSRAGLTNPAQGGEPRYMLFALVLFSTLLSGALIRLVMRPKQP